MSESTVVTALIGALEKIGQAKVFLRMVSLSDGGDLSEAFKKECGKLADEL